MSSDIKMVQDMLQDWGNKFAEDNRKNPGKGKYHKKDPVRKSEFHWALDGLKPDECRAFLKAYQAKPEIVSFKPNGSFTISGKRNRGKGPYHILGRYDEGITNFAEYLTHIGAFGELVLDHGWPIDLLLFEKGEFDIIGYAGDESSMGRAILLVEAKARISFGNDSLESLRESFCNKASDPLYEIKNPNHLRKWDELFSRLDKSPIYLWLVANDTRWLYFVRKDGSQIKIKKVNNSPDFKRLLSQV